MIKRICNNCEKECHRISQHTFTDNRDDILCDECYKQFIEDCARLNKEADNKYSELEKKYGGSE